MDKTEIQSSQPCHVPLVTRKESVPENAPNSSLYEAWHKIAGNMGFDLESQFILHF